MILDKEGMVIEASRVSSPIPSKSFRGINIAVSSIVEEIEDKVKDVELMIMEEPFPNAQFSSGLFALDSVIYNRLKDRLELYTVNPNMLGSIHGKRKYSKTESVELSMKLLEVFTAEGYENVTKHKWCHDESEAFIYLAMMVASMHLLGTEFSKRLLKINRNLYRKEVFS